MTNHISPTPNIAGDQTPGETIKYAFLDTETSGTTRYDCILSFALVMTDAVFNPFQQISIPVARPPHVVPHPKALLVNRVDLDMLDRGMRPREAFAYLAESLDAYARCGVTFIAHNMRFDLRFIREGLFANLCDPYPMSRRGAGIADTLAMARAIATVDHGALTVPVIDGKPSFKLGPLLRANGVLFDDDTAHDALTDAYGVRDLARLMRVRSPALFDHLIAMSRRDHVVGFLEENALVRHFTHFGTPRYPVSRLVTFGTDDRNAAVLIDLTVDPAPILAMTAQELAAAMCALPRILSVVRLNAMPVLLPITAIAAEDETRRLHHRGPFDRSSARARLQGACAGGAPHQGVRPSPHQNGWKIGCSKPSPASPIRNAARHSMRRKALKNGRISPRASRMIACASTPAASFTPRRRTSSLHPSAPIWMSGYPIAC